MSEASPNGDEHRATHGLQRIARAHPRAIVIPGALSAYFEIDASELGAKAVGNPQKAVAIDVAALRAARALPEPRLPSGLAYDVATGAMEVVVPPERV